MSYYRPSVTTYCPECDAPTFIEVSVQAFGVWWRETRPLLSPHVCRPVSTAQEVAFITRMRRGKRAGQRHRRQRDGRDVV